MADLVRLDQAQRHLLRPVAADDGDLALKITQASEIVREFCRRDDGSPSVDTWDVESVPPIVQAAVLAQLADLVMHRGDVPPDPVSAGGGICAVAAQLLRAGGYRDPVLA